MRNTIDLTEILVVGDIVWSNAIGDVVKIVSTNADHNVPIKYTSKKSKGSTFYTSKYGYHYNIVIPNIITEDAIPELVPSKDNWDWSTFKRDLPIDTCCVVSDNKIDWRLRYYAGNGNTYDCGYTSQKKVSITYWKYVIPVSKFNFETKTFDEKDNYGIK